MSHINEVVNMNNITVQDVYKEIGGIFHCYQTHDPNLQPNHTILRYANTILLEKHFVFHINVLEHAALHACGRAVFRICLNPFCLTTLHC